MKEDITLNSKRQTIWLVSMLGLMVVLSAYYLLTEDIKSFDFTALQGNPDLISEVKVDIESSVHDPQFEPQDDQTATADERILQQMHTQQTSANDYFLSLQMKRHEELKKQTEHLLNTITDHKQNPESVVTATNQLETISDLQEKIDHVEETLLRDFPQAVILQEGDDWKVIVQAKKLEKSQGVSIVDLMMEQLQVNPEHIQLRYMSP
jgi:stage III sporulation protein AH